MPVFATHRSPTSSSFASDESGSTAIIFAVSFTALIAFVGMAVDGARWLSGRHQHATAVDTALLSGARRLQIDPTDGSGALALAGQVYQANAPRGMVSTVQFVQDVPNSIVTFTGGATIPTMLLRIVGITDMPIAAPAKAVYAQTGQNAGSNLEIAVMLDVTGSMCDDGTGPCTSGTKLTGVKQAAADLATIVLGQSSTYTSRLALVPFASTIRIDADGSTNPLMQTLTNLPRTWSGWHGTTSNCTGSGSYVGEIWVGNGSCTETPTYVSNWKLVPCVTERSFDNGAGFDPGDSPPGQGNWLLAHGGDRSQSSWDSSETPMTNYTGTSAADMTWTWNYTPDGSGCMSQPGNEVLPLTTNLDTATQRFNSLTAFGPTAGALGTVWTQYMLSPNWSGIWTGNQRPGSYSDTQAKQSNGAPVLRKVALLMTDGGYNTSRQAASTDPQFMKKVSDNAIAVCDNMKNNGIEIYTVAFDMASLGSTEATMAESTLKACGTDISHFYNSLTVAQLKTAFRDIALKLTPVRLTQ